jgi:hypothetical protein
MSVVESTALTLAAPSTRGRAASLRIAILNTDYPAFLGSLYGENRGLARRSHDEQYAARARTLFGFADFHPTILRRMGHQADEIVINAEPMQKRWAAERGVRHSRGRRRLGLRGGFAPWIEREPDSRWMYEILEARIRATRPDVVLNMAIDGMPATVTRQLRRHTRLLVGLAEPPVLLRPQDWSTYDLILAPSEGVVDRLREIKVPCELWRFAFEPNRPASATSRSRSSDRPSPNTQSGANCWRTSVASWASRCISGRRRSSTCRTSRWCGAVFAGRRGGGHTTRCWPAPGSR